MGGITVLITEGKEDMSILAPDARQGGVPCTTDTSCYLVAREIECFVTRALRELPSGFNVQAESHLRLVYLREGDFRIATVTFEELLYAGIVYFLDYFLQIAMARRNADADRIPHEDEEAQGGAPGDQTLRRIFIRGRSDAKGCM